MDNKDAKHTPTPGEIQVMEGRTLLHVETHADNPNGAGLPICSIPKSRAADADRIVLTWNSHDALVAEKKVLVNKLERWERYARKSPDEMAVIAHRNFEAVETVGKQRDALVAALEKYGRHVSGCGASIPNQSHSCDCGFGVALKQVPHG